MDRAFDLVPFAIPLIGSFDALFHVPSFSVQNESPMLSVDRGAIAGRPRPDLMLPGHGARREFVGDCHGVGSFLIIVVEILAAGCYHAGRSIEIQYPAKSIESVNSVIAKFTRAVIPHPVPAVMKTIHIECPLGRGAEPEIVVD